MFPRIWLLLCAAHSVGGDGENCPPVHSNTSSKALRQLYYMPVPASASTTFTRLVRRIACEINNQTKDLDCCLGGGLQRGGIVQAEARWCSATCPRPSCAALVGCDFCECRATPQLRQLTLPPEQRPLTITVLRHPFARYVSHFFLKQVTFKDQGGWEPAAWLNKVKPKVTRYGTFER